MDRKCGVLFPYMNQYPPHSPTSADRDDEPADAHRHVLRAVVRRRHWRRQRVRERAIPGPLSRRDLNGRSTLALLILRCRTASAIGAPASRSQKGEA